MGWLRRARTTQIGVDIEGSYLRAVQVTRVGEQVFVEAGTEVRRPDSSGLVTTEDAALLLDAMDRQGFTNAPLVVGVPSAVLFSEMLELPPRSSGAPLERLAVMEVSRLRRCEPESFELACWDLPAPRRAGDATHMFGVGCEHEPAELIVDAFESAGALVMALDVRACALARAIGAGSASGVTAIVELGWEHARLVATLGGVVLYERLVEEAGLHGAAAEIARALDVDDDVAAFILSGDDAAVELGVMDEAGSIIDSVWSGAVEEVGASLAYAEHRYIDAETGRLVLVGPGAAMDRALAVFGSAVGVDATVCTPSSVATCGDGLGQLASAPSLMAALGFATWEG